MCLCCTVSLEDGCPLTKAFSKPGKKKLQLHVALASLASCMTVDECFLSITFNHFKTSHFAFQKISVCELK